MEHTTNQITLRGSLVELPEFSHENHGRRFCRFLLEVPRLSGTADILPVIAPENLLGLLDPTFQKIVFWCFYGIAAMLLIVGMDQSGFRKEGRK